MLKIGVCDGVPYIAPALLKRLGLVIDPKMMCSWKLEVLKQF